MRIVGTPPVNVGRSCRMKSQSPCGCRNRPGSSRSLPTIQPAYGVPHALTWNIGTMISRRPLSSRRNVAHTANECRYTERWLYTTPLGSPVVPVV